MNLRDLIAERLFGKYIQQRIAEAYINSSDLYPHAWRSLYDNPNDIPAQTTTDIIQDSINAYRTNPLAYRIIELSTSYVLGQGIAINAQPQTINTFIHEFWQHPLNNMDNRLHQICTELALTGDLFITFHTNPFDGMSYIRITPSLSIDIIETAPNDIEQEIRYHVRGTPTNPNGTWWDAENMHHYSINRLPGATRGQGDLVTILPWLRRYKDWLTDRVIINKYKGAYLWDVTITGGTQASITQKRNELATPPPPGSVIVHNDAETWKAIKPEIGADDVAEDGKALRTAIATGAGLPLHFLSEGGDVNRATAQEMGEPTRRNYEKRQTLVTTIIRNILDTVISRAQQAHTLSHRKYTLTITCPDLTTADNVAISQAISQAISALATAADRHWIDDATAKEWLYKFAQQPLSQPTENTP